MPSDKWDVVAVRANVQSETETPLDHVTLMLLMSKSAHRGKEVNQGVVVVGVVINVSALLY